MSASVNMTAEVDRPPAGTACTVCEHLGNHFCQADAYHPRDPEAAMCQPCIDGTPCARSLALKPDYHIFVAGANNEQYQPAEVRHIAPPADPVRIDYSPRAPMVKVDVQRPNTMNWDAIVQRVSKLAVGETAKFLFPSGESAQKYANSLRSVIAKREDLRFFKFSIGTELDRVTVKRKRDWKGIHEYSDKSLDAVAAVPRDAATPEESESSNAETQVCQPSSDADQDVRLAKTWEEFLVLAPQIEVGETAYVICPPDWTMDKFRQRVASSLANRIATRLRRFTTSRVDSEQRIVVVRLEDPLPAEPASPLKHYLGGYKAEQKAEATKMLKAGLSRHEVCRRTGLSVNTVIKLKVQMGLPTREKESVAEQQAPARIERNANATYRNALATCEKEIETKIAEMTKEISDLQQRRGHLVAAAEGLRYLLERDT